jgi:HEAT repeat protein
MPRRAAIFAALSLFGCDLMLPSHVEVPDIQEAMARERYKVVCVGLDMKDDATRTFATEQLEQVSEPLAQECICSHMADDLKDWDIAVARGIKTTKRDDLASCLVDLVKNPSLKKRVEAIQVLSGMSAPVARDGLAAISADSKSKTDARVAALKAIGGDKKYTNALMKLAAEEEDVEVRTAAVTGLGGMKEKPVIAQLRKSVTDDPEGAVRGAALAALKTSGVSDATEMICKAMMDDESAIVRSQAVGSFKGTKRTKALRCLRERALKLEEDPGVRQKILDVLKSSPKDDAANILCDAIPFWARSYLVKGGTDKIPGTDIIAAQNTRDFERSYECVQKAVRSSRGYSCYAKAYTAHWFRELGGSAHVPRCPGYE